WSKYHRLPRHVNYRRKGEDRYVLDVIERSGFRPAYREFLRHANDSISMKTFDRMLERSVGRGVLREIEKVMDTAVALWKAGKTEAPPADRASWKRSLLLSYVHSRDLAVIMHALGYPRATKGLHDVSEFVPADWLQKTRLDHADPW